MLDLLTDVEIQQDNAKLVLVLGEDSRSFLSVIRSLGRAGFCVHVVCYDRTSIALKSKYIQAAYFYNYQSYNPEQWQQNVLALIQRYQYQVIFPCDERSIYPLYQLRGQIPATTKLAIANKKALNVLFDKWQTKQEAKQCGVPVAAGMLVNFNQQGFDELQATFSLPFVIKPLQSFTQNSLNKRHKVTIVHSKADFTQFVASNPRDANYLVEAYFSGNGEGIAVLAWQGKLKSAFAYKRLAEPHSGGGSSYRESSKIHLDQLDATAKMCQNTELSGLAMFEFRRNEHNNQWILVEVNARAWGGMPLAEYAGVDFPAQYVKHLCGLQDDSHQASLDFGYPQVRARALLTDLYEIKRESELKAKHSTRIDSLLHIAKRTANIMRVVTNKESIDSLRRDDVRPFMGEMSMIIRGVFFQSDSNRFITSYRRWRIKSELKQVLAKKISRRVLFICYGNIIRSPFAERYYQDAMHRVSLTAQTESFGFHKHEARPSPNIAIVAAASFHCDLHPHSSRCLSQLDINDSDIVFYFDNRNRNLLQSYYQTNHAYCLSDLLDSRYPTLSEIDDPYESDVETIKACYQKISNAIDNLIAINKEVA